MMTRRVFLACLVAGVASSAEAQARKMDEDEIRALLAGNTAIGSWDGVPYRQYFDPGGVTIFAQDGARSARGEWQVSGESYQSLWPGDSAWESWFVMEYLGAYYWVSRSTPPTPFTVLAGQQLVE